MIADRLAIYVSVWRPQDTATCSSPSHGILRHQIYCDFSGYSDIAIGSARILGSAQGNFDTPYASRSVSNSGAAGVAVWFRDYVYYPMGGNRVSKPRWYTNLSHLRRERPQHGRTVVWGRSGSLYLVIAATGGTTRLAHALGLADDGRVRIALRVAVTFALTCMAWVIFPCPLDRRRQHPQPHVHRLGLLKIRTEQFLCDHAHRARRHRIS